MSKIKNGGLDQHGAEPFEQQQFEAAGVEWVKPYTFTHSLSSGGSRISVRGMRRDLAPIFSEGMALTFYGRLLARIRVARIFRGWVRPGVDPGFLVGGRWRDRRPRTRRGRREAPERRGGEVREGRCGPSPVWGSGGIVPRKFLKFNLQICTF